MVVRTHRLQLFTTAESVELEITARAPDPMTPAGSVSRPAGIRWGDAACTGIWAAWEEAGRPDMAFWLARIEGNDIETTDELVTREARVAALQLIKEQL